MNDTREKLLFPNDTLSKSSRYQTGEDSEGRYVYDRDIQRHEDICVLWCAETQVYEAYEKARVLPFVTAIRDDEVAGAMIEAYEKWHHDFAKAAEETWRENNPIKALVLTGSCISLGASSAIEDLIRPLRVAMENRNPKQKEGAPLLNVSGYYRSTHCWRCKGGLDSNHNRQCSACKWLRCDCGACGCSA